jgi:hypothetical protein
MSTKFKVSAVVASAIIMVLVFGCASGGNGTPSTSYTDPVVDFSLTNLSKAAVVCGLDHVDASKWGWNGNCPGAVYDTTNVAKLCRNAGFKWIDVLRTEQCTAANISNHIMRAINSLSTNGLLFVYFSGHGGQEPELVSGSESDGLDETVCLYDVNLRDDVIHGFLLGSVPKSIRVFMVTDCCHSGSNFKAVRPHNYAAAISRRLRSGGSREASEPNLLHWGGCTDAESSYGSNSGGAMTRAMYLQYSGTRSYASWFSLISAVFTGSDQHPSMAETGASFSGMSSLE